MSLNGGNGTAARSQDNDVRQVMNGDSREREINRRKILC